MILVLSLCELEGLSIIIVFRSQIIVNIVEAGPHNKTVGVLIHWSCSVSP